MTARSQARTVNPQLVYDALALRKRGKKQEEIAAALGVAQGTISVILRQNGLGGHLVKWERR